MSDPQKFINAYVDNAMGMIHEQTSTILQLKTQVRIANEIVSERDALIASLQEQLEQCKNTASDLSKSVEEADTIKASYEAIKNKVSHMDAVTAQANETKQALIAKNAECEVLKQEIETLKIDNDALKSENDNLTKLVPSVKKLINKKKVMVEETPAVVVESRPKDENDDF
jgi:chromosome segregation ATPase